MRKLLWDLLQKLHVVISRYQNNKKNLTWVEARRWYKVTVPLMKLQARIDRDRCVWLKKKED
jgi:hypothetical protein